MSREVLAEELPLLTMPSFGIVLGGASHTGASFGHAVMTMLHAGEHNLQA